MAGDAAYKLMTVEAFLDWDDGSETRYELYGGRMVAMAPATGTHGSLQMRLGGRMDLALAVRRPCRVIGEAGIARNLDSSDYYVADIAATCAPDRRGGRITEDPFLIAEVLSDSTETKVRTVKLAAYRRLPTVAEIVLLDSRRPFAEVHRRIPGDLWVVDLVIGLEGVLTLESVPLSLPLGTLWEGLDLGDVEEDAPADQPA
ncbi:MAG: hypothetical protein RLY86_1283 [Pseudomonadota bacterium]|jgi:Uma2 family endonuclease